MTTRPRRESATPKRVPSPSDVLNDDETGAADTATSERVLSAALEVVGELGLSNVGVRHIAARAGLAPGTVMYHFESKAEIMIETLRWTQRRFVRECRVELFSEPSAVKRIIGFVDRYLPPEDRSDASWMLWLEVWNQAATNPSVASLQAEPDLAIITMLEEMVRYGVATGEFCEVDPSEFAMWFGAMLDGLGVQYTVGTPRVEPRDQLVAVAIRVAALTLGFTPPDQPPATAL